MRFWLVKVTVTVVCMHHMHDTSHPLHNPIFRLPSVRRLSDLVGADIGFHVGKNFLDEKPQQFYPAAIFKLMVDHNMLGEKTPSGGFYSFEKNKCARHITPQLEIAFSCADKGLTTGQLASASLPLCKAEPLHAPRLPAFSSWAKRATVD